MLDNFNDYRHTIAAMSAEDPDLAAELQERLDYQVQIDGEIATKLYEASRLPGFSGTLLPGTRIGREPFRSTDTLPSWATSILGLIIGPDADGVDNSDVPPPHPATSATPPPCPVTHADHSQDGLASSDRRQMVSSVDRQATDESHRRELVAELQRLQEELNGVQSQQAAHDDQQQGGVPPLITAPNPRKRKGRCLDDDAHESDYEGSGDDNDEVDECDAGVLENQGTELIEVLARDSEM
ncbi:hypothetical protein FISHEDRAFT_73701 [Fistulina hepatica ATCC 64428]|uniref:Uncharacterized protein n=1 Tax=Fistulina hepatica ATCC 64428 TaxID=1128425 RepID=A0A0D7ACL7_9AGAR|nr:hypothetical protein FISHEDRAFT_73701 [Fistulina hepatica ATCC 64428]